MTLEDIIARGNRGHHHPGFDGNILRCADGFVVSVVAGGGTHCTPRPTYCAYLGVTGELLPALGSEVAHDYPGPYTHLEVGMPNQRPEPWTWWGGFAEEPDHPTSTVYSRVPVDLVRQLIADHGGEVAEMTEPRTVLLDVHHHHDPGGVATCINLPGAVITIGMDHDMDTADKADLCAVLGSLLPLMGELWAQPEQDGPMVYDLRKPADG